MGVGVRLGYDVRYAPFKLVWWLSIEQLAITEPGSQLLSSKCARLDWRLDLLSSKTEQVD